MSSIVGNDHGFGAGRVLGIVVTNGACESVLYDQRSSVTWFGLGGFLLVDLLSWGAAMVFFIVVLVVRIIGDGPWRACGGRLKPGTSEHSVC